MATEQPIPSLTPESLLQRSIKALPIVRWAYGVAGVLAALALGVSYFKSPPAALIGAAVMIALMILLVIFREIVRRRTGGMLASFVTWSVALLFIASGFGLFSSVFFHWPTTYQDLVGQIMGTQKPSVDHQFKDQTITPDQIPDNLKQ